MQAHQIKFPRTAHYYTLGAPSPDTKHLVIALHGYGQLASRFIYKFDQLGKEYWIVAPEGFSRFYWEQTSGIVGASWMTKEDRLSEIEDYTNYLQHLYYACRTQLDEAVPTTVIGFSQGGATAARWMHRLQPKVERLLLWGAGFPMDIDYRPQAAYWQHLAIHIAQGRQDEYASPEHYQAHDAFLEQQPIRPQVHGYEGGHAIHRALLKEILELPI